MNDNESEHETMFEGDCITEAIAKMSAAICEHIANDPLESVALIGIQAGGVPLARRIARNIRDRFGREIDVGALDISMYRDDIGKRKTLPMIRETTIPFDINDKIIILTDDVLQSGRSVRAALDALTISSTKTITLSGFGSGRHNLQYRAYITVVNTLSRFHTISSNHWFQ